MRTFGHCHVQSLPRLSLNSFLFIFLLFGADLRPILCYFVFSYGAWCICITPNVIECRNLRKLTLLSNLPVDTGPAIAGCNTFSEKECWQGYLSDYAQRTGDQYKYISYHRYGNSGCASATNFETLLGDPDPNSGVCGASCGWAAQGHVLCGSCLVFVLDLAS